MDVTKKRKMSSSSSSGDGTPSSSDEFSPYQENRVEYEEEEVVVTRSPVIYGESPSAYTAPQHPQSLVMTFGDGGGAMVSVATTRSTTTHVQPTHSLGGLAAAAVHQRSLLGQPRPFPPQGPGRSQVEDSASPGVLDGTNLTFEELVRKQKQFEKEAKRLHEEIKKREAEQNKGTKRKHFREGGGDHGTVMHVLQAGPPETFKVKKSKSTFGLSYAELGK